MAWNEPGGNDNDPWGNRNNNSGGPPDLDEVFKNLKGKLDGLFGKRSGGSSGGGPANNQGGGGQGSGQSSRGSGLPGGGLSGRGLGLLGGLIGVVWLASGIYLVQAGNAGVVTQFGEHVATTGPGPHWHLPWPFQKVEKVNVAQNRTTKLSNQQILTQDENIVDVELSVQYNIKSAEDYVFNVRDPDQTLEDVVESALREVVGSTGLEAVLTTGRDSVRDTTREDLQNVLDTYEAGIIVSAVSLERAQPPEEVQAAFSDAIKAREDRERVINEAQAYRNKVLPEARGDAQRMIEESKAYKTRVEQAAIDESERFLSLYGEYKKAPDVTRDRLYLEAMESVLSNSSKVLMDNEGSNSMMYLPIDKLIEQNRSGERGRQDSGGLSGTSPLSSSSNDSPRFADLPGTIDQSAREALRSRERGALR